MFYNYSFRNTKGGGIFRGRGYGQTRMKLWDKCKEVALKYELDSIHKEKLGKPGTLYILRGCVCQNIPLRGHRDSTKIIQL